MAQQRLYAYNLTRQSFLSLGVRRAVTRWDRLCGLMGRLKPHGGDGIWVVPSRGIHTSGLLFPIDVVYLDAQMRVIQVMEHVGPFRWIAPFRRRCASVLELPARSVFGSDTQAGDTLLVCSPEDLYEYWRIDPAAHSFEAERAVQAWG